MIDAATALVFARCAGFVTRAPGFSHPSVPRAVRAGLALVLTLGLAPGVHPVRGFDAARMSLAFVFELIVGACIGIAASLVYDGAYAGGRALDDYVGIRGSVPSLQLYAASGFGRIWALAFVGGFFLLGGYEIVLRALAEGFTRFPPGTALDSESLMRFALALPVVIVKAALLVAGPAIGLVFTAQVSLGAISRVIPRFASFTVAFPLVFAVALIATLLTVPLLLARSGEPSMPLPFGPAP